LQVVPAVPSVAAGLDERWLQRHGLEWVYRLAHEPRRLWRRYLFGNARFLYAVLRDRRAA